MFWKGVEFFWLFWLFLLSHVVINFIFIDYNSLNWNNDFREKLLNKDPTELEISCYATGVIFLIVYYIKRLREEQVIVPPPPPIFLMDANHQSQYFSA